MCDQGEDRGRSLDGVRGEEAALVPLWRTPEIKGQGAEPGTQWAGFHGSREDLCTDMCDTQASLRLQVLRELLLPHPRSWAVITSSLCWLHPCVFQLVVTELMFCICQAGEKLPPSYFCF